MARSASSDKAFIDKIKTIGINTGGSHATPAKPTQYDGPTCPDCGGPAAEVIGVIVKVPQKKKEKK
jgi:hypothetical protein